MHAVMAKDEVNWAEMRHQERLARAERNQMLKDGHPKPAASRTGIVAYPIGLAALFAMLVVVLAVAVA
jgi:hypothetical protein